jgi:YihY family inner membrane protein
MRVHGASRVFKAERYLDRDLWTAELSNYRLPGRAGIRLLRVLVAVVRGPFDGQLNLEVTALVYRTLLSIVPLLAVAFSVLKAFGVQYRIEPLLVQMLSPLGPGGAEVATRIVEFVSTLGVSVLGAVGLKGLFYTVVSVIEKTEDALNRIWHVRRSRTLMRKFSDYLSILLVGPVLVFAALGIIASAQNNRLVQRVIALTPFKPETVAVVWQLAPFVLLGAAFTLLYRFLPYARVARWQSSTEVIEDFVAHGFLARAVEPDGVVLARTPELVTVAEVLAAIREPAHAVDLDVADGPAVDALRQRDDAVDHALAGLALRSVATLDSTPEAAVAKLSAYRRR